MQIAGKAKQHVLADVGTALLQVKNARDLTAEDMRIVLGLKADDMVAHYISGMAEMGFVAWMRALEAWPELAERLEETAAERAMRSRQRPLDLEIPTKKRKAA